jgi:hypothetical protein
MTKCLQQQEKNSKNKKTNRKPTREMRGNLQIKRYVRAISTNDNVYALFRL